MLQIKGCMFFVGRDPAAPFATSPIPQTSVNALRTAYTGKYVQLKAIETWLLINIITTLNLSLFGYVDQCRAASLFCLIDQRPPD